MTVLEYCIEEVSRQGHDIKVFDDGGVRVAWMMNAWEVAKLINAVALPSIADIEHIGSLIEPKRNDEGFRTCGVCVGSRICPPPEAVRRLLLALWGRRDEMQPLEFYRAFLEIHPFKDGNGRVGKILLAWLSNTLDKPEFPSNDFWGRAIRNP